jgi:endonuclease YncB( thermonuclease family)
MEELYLSGPARVIDGDTVVVASRSTPERCRCRRARDSARRERQARSGRARHWSADLPINRRKNHGREVGCCSTSNGVNINQAIIASGAALACPRYDVRYLPYEQAAALAAQPRSVYYAAR